MAGVNEETSPLITTLPCERKMVTLESLRNWVGEGDGAGKKFNFSEKLRLSSPKCKRRTQI